MMDGKPGQRVGEIKLDHDWDAVMLVLLNKVHRGDADLWGRKGRSGGGAEGAWLEGEK